MVKEEFTALFKGYKVPKDLVSLFEFQESDQITSYYSNAIRLLEEESEVVEELSGDEGFVKAFIPFAEADAQGGVYAFWIKDQSQKSLDDMPIVVFAEDGWVYPITSSLKELLQIAAYDVEPALYEDFYGFEDRELLEEDGEFVATEFNKEFLEWLRNDAKLKPLLTFDAVDEVVENAKAKHSEELDEFLNKYLAE